MTSHGLLLSAAKAYGLSPGVIAPELSRTPPPHHAETGIDWVRIDPHALGQLHQRRILAGRPLTRKARGAFYTPPQVARLLAEEAIPLARSDPDPLPEVLDPACGCGSLLVEAMACLCRHGGATALTAASRLRGFDCDPDSVLLTRLALITLAHGLGVRVPELATLARCLSQRILARDVLASNPAAAAHCVLMNPPYVRAATAEGDRDSIRRRFATASGAFDLHIPFIDLALQLVRPGGSLGLLTSDKFLVADYGRKLRARLAEGTTLVRLVGLADCLDARPGALVAQMATIAVRQRPPRDHQVQVLHPQTLSAWQQRSASGTTVRQTDLLHARWPALRAVPAEQRIISRMTSGAVKPLRLMALVRGGVRGFDYEACCQELAEAQGQADEMMVVCPGNLRAYRAPSGHPVRLTGRQWEAPCLRRRPDRLSPKLWEFFARPKLLVKGVGRRPTAALSGGASALLVAVWGVWAEEDFLYALLGLLNSKPAAWLHYQQLYTARIPRGSLRIPLSWLAAFPVPVGDLSELRRLALLRAGATSPAQRATLQEQIDAAAATAYGLSEEELRLMDGAPLRDVQT